MSGTQRTHMTPKMKTTVIPPEHISWLRLLLANKKELGGALHFNRKGLLDNISVYTGKHMEVILPDAFQVEWHSHPKGAFVEMPSVTDLKAAEKRKLQIGDFSGELSIVVATHGIIVYSYKGNKKLDASQWSTIAELLQNGQDNKKGLRKQVAQIRLFNFDIDIFFWEDIESKGLPLRFCMRKYVVDPLPRKKKSNQTPFSKSRLYVRKKLFSK